MLSTTDAGAIAKALRGGAARGAPSGVLARLRGCDSRCDTAFWSARASTDCFGACFGVETPLRGCFFGVETPLRESLSSCEATRRTSSRGECGTVCGSCGHVKSSRCWSSEMSTPRCCGSVSPTGTAVAGAARGPRVVYKEF